MAPAPTAFFDANVFYGARLRSLVLFLARAGLFRARWSAQVHDEWMRNLLRNRPDLRPSDLERTRRAMDAAVLDALVTGHERLVAAMDLPDPDDRHVLAAAVVCRADVIVTFDLRDFPADPLAAFGLSAVHPDDFLSDLERARPEAFAAALRRDVLHYRAPVLRLDEYAASLRRAGVPRVADRVLDPTRLP